MSIGIIGKKLGMTQVYAPDGKAIPVTVVQAGPCVVVQRKTKAKDGYDAVQLGLDDRDRDLLALLVEDLGHAQLATNDSDAHGITRP